MSHYATNKYDVILLDWNMPQMSGLELLDRIKQKSRTPPPVVMMITAYGDDENYKRAMELGADGVLMNTAIAAAQNPVLMAQAMKKAVESGREAYLAGRMPRKLYSAIPSSPTTGMIGKS